MITPKVKKWPIGREGGGVGGGGGGGVDFDLKYENFSKTTKGGGKPSCG